MFTSILSPCLFIVLLIPFLTKRSMQQNQCTWYTEPQTTTYDDPITSRKAFAIAEHNDDIRIIRQRRECIYAHTIIRSIHGLVSMNWNEELAYEAEEWAIYLASKEGQLKHSSFLFDNGTSYGENLFYLLGSVEPTRCHIAIHRWYNEIHKYDFQNPPKDNSKAGHFTQLVWRTSSQVGVGVAYNSKKKATYVVARYTPPGNINGVSTEHFVAAMLPGTHIPSEKDLLPSWARTPIPADVEVKYNFGTAGERPCKDNTDCTYYISQGDCEKNIYKDYMLNNCYKSCTKCKPGPPIDGGWSKWQKVSECSVSCGGGIIVFYRFCSAPIPENNGKQCEGDKTKTKICNLQDCPSEKSGHIIHYTVFGDLYSSCEPYAKMGHCTAGVYTHWMKTNCVQSCYKYLKVYYKPLNTYNTQ